MLLSWGSPLKAAQGTAEMTHQKEYSVAVGACGSCATNRLAAAAKWHEFQQFCYFILKWRKGRHVVAALRGHADSRIPLAQHGMPLYGLLPMDLARGSLYYCF